jgi:hypothetical protein
MKKIAILQSNYIPWKGYFDLINKVDEFILYDDMQYTKNDWRNRNTIKTRAGVEWLTIPVGQNINRRIREVAIPNAKWQIKHWKTLYQNYSRTPYFEEIAALFEPLYTRTIHENLSELNRTFIEAVCSYLGITTKISNSWDYRLGAGKTERLVDLCMQAGAGGYISGPAAKDYIQADLFDKAGIELSWMDYSGYPEYEQQYPPFVHGVTVLDLLFHVGPEAPWYIWGWRNSEGDREKR